MIAAGLPKGVLNFITGRAAEIGPAITESPAVRAISFTGSTAAGEQIHRAAAMTTRTQMELGGKNPLIVMEDADLDLAVDLAIKGGLSLSGQACTGTSRVLVISGFKAAFTEKLVASVKALKIGSGMTAGMDIGPLATAQAARDRARLHRDRQARGHVAVGGERLTGGCTTTAIYVSPAIFTDVTQSMRIAREEIFGPVIA